ncbi:MAG: hypothetical protein JO320_13900 [Alphaproteobacteria bacterium]|nr:hypothetical protein [Acetobacteraceae bacterium]MBV9376126.1 hypothetical protein [Alphaproteobacteria bacterium]
MPNPGDTEPHDPEDWDEGFVKRGREIQEVLQSAEDALVDAGFEDYIVATTHGTWHWQTVARARTAEAKE